MSQLSGISEDWCDWQKQMDTDAYFHWVTQRTREASIYDANLYIYLSSLIVNVIVFAKTQRRDEESPFFIVAVIKKNKKKSITIPAGVLWSPASGHQIKLRQAKLPGREGWQKLAVNPRLHTRARLAQIRYK